MSEFFYGNLVGLSQVLVGHPLDTIKTFYQIGTTIGKITPKKLYRGVTFPTISSVITNGLMFQTNKSIYESSNNYFVSGALTGIITSPIINIFEVYKIKTQLGYPIKNIFKLSYSGISATIFRESLGMSIYFGGYHYLINKEISPFLSGGIVGSLSWLFTYPIDVIKTRLQSEVSKSWSSAIKRGHLFKGLEICLLRSFIVNGISFKIYNKLNN
jgi:solute carrier family 25 (mitochondrial carnitine/acylcarnitine transporter), member 20/29